MSIATNIQKRPGRTPYYVRVGVPLKLQPVLKRKEIWRSLKTTDPRQARDRAAPVIASYRQQFADLEQRREPSLADLQAAVWSHYETELNQDAQARAALPTDAATREAANKLATDIEAGRVPWSADPIVQLNATIELIVMKDAAKLDRERRAVQLAELKKHLATGETALIEWKADDVIQSERLLIAKGSPAYRDLCQRLQRVQIEVLQRAAERDAGNWSGVPSDPIVVPADLTHGKRIAAPGETLMELYDKFKAERIGDARPDTWDQNRKIVKLFAEFVGEASHVSVITRKAVRNWKQELARWPVKAADSKAFEGMSFRKVLEANETVKKPAISQKSVNKYLAALGSFARWLLQNEYIDDDVMSGMYLSIDKRKKSRFPFSKQQLQTIFNSPLFGTCLGDDAESKPGNVAVRDWRYWLPLIAIYSGARLGELCQLLTADVRQLHGVWIFHITEVGDEDEGGSAKSTKTEGSMRVVPVHSRLIELGFLDYHAGVVARGEQRLFPETERDKRGYFGEASKFFNAYLKAVGVKVDRRVNFHSFRHGVADALRSAGYLDETFGPLLGHAKSSTTGRYGVLPEGPLRDRVRMIEAIGYGLALAHRNG
ncbi:site-specific integrase [Bradyrhizobium diazoefficiens]|uniref:site-specific integrase n=1 Tax=Bradyrhizobium diazoefficiens TaxID=1355477 RepID=UPI00271518F0|nr:site-specific integrase [Bradyrhizobium diazoefficiens]WLB42113.1 site-specific integrase [Bradyrhizobium diazoefficiens]